MACDPCDGLKSTYNPGADSTDLCVGKWVYDRDESCAKQDVILLGWNKVDNSDSDKFE